jgi:PGF-pre-PGF domain-containing protein
MKHKKEFLTTLTILIIALFALIVWAGPGGVDTTTNNAQFSVPSLPGPQNFLNANVSATSTLEVSADRPVSWSFDGNFTNGTVYFWNGSDPNVNSITEVGLAASYSLTSADFDANFSVANASILDSGHNLSDGVYNITVKVTNASDDILLFNKSIFTDSSQFMVIDGTNPYVTINTPANGSFIGSSEAFTFNATITNDTGWTALAYVNLSNNSDTNNSYTFSGDSAEAGGDFVLIYNQSVLVEGANTLTVNVNDTANNTNSSQFVTVFVDTVPPIVNLEVGQNHDNWTWTTDTTPTLTYNYTDNTSPNASCELFIDEVGYGVNSTVLNDTQTNFTVNTSLTSGKKAWYVNCTDLGSNSNSSLNNSAAFYLDVVSPVAIGTPANNSWTSETRADNVNFTFEFVSGFVNSSTDNTFNNVTCELFVTNSTGVLVPHGINITALNNTNMTIQNNQTLLADKATLAGSNVNWTVNCTYNSTIIQPEGSFYTLRLDNVTPITPAVEISSRTASSITASIATSGDVTSCSDAEVGTSGMSGSGTSWSLTRSSLSAETAYNFQVTCSDAAGNNAISATTTISTLAADGGGSGGTGSSGGSGNQVKGDFAKRIWTSINEGETATVEVENGVVGITEVNFKVKETLWGAWLKVSKKDSLPSSMDTFSNEVYKYVEITKSSIIKEEAIDNAEVKFKVLKSWLSENGVSKENVALFRFADDKWNELSTVMGQDDGTYIHYTAETPGFSYFVIGQTSAEAAAPTAEVAAEEGAAAEEAGEEAAEEAGEAAAEDGKAWSWIVLVIVIIAVVAVLLWLRSRAKPRPVPKNVSKPAKKRKK